MDNIISVARQTPNRGRMHVFLGHPLSDGCDKTTVEPGNTYSPGVWTCGVSVWIEKARELYTPDLLTEEDIKWGFEGKKGCPPVLISEYTIEDCLKVVHRLAHSGTKGSEGVDFNEVKVTSVSEQQISIYIIVKDIGPAGGKIDSIEWDNKKAILIINGSLKLYVEQNPEECYIVSSDEVFDSPMAILRYPISLSTDSSFRLMFKTEHGFTNRAFGHSLLGRKKISNLSVNEGFELVKRSWQKELPVRVFAPDIRVQQLWEREAFHILSAMECGLPRIGAVNYPVFWLRDGVLVLRALDLFGRHDLARVGNDYLSSLYFGGGFGAESDAPGQGIWALVSHAMITGDQAWLEEVFPYIKKRVEWIEKMLNADEPIWVVGENRMPAYMHSPGINILCLPSQDGVIHGRMDWHSPDFFINAWAQCGLTMAAEAAGKLGYNELADKWSQTAKKLENAIQKSLLPYYGDNDRDTIITPYPTKTICDGMDPQDNSQLKQKFKDWYLRNRLTPDMERVSEPLWTYFEAAQIHNAIMLGYKNLAWINLDGMLGDKDKWGVSAFVEGSPWGNEFLNFRNGEERRGWLNKGTAIGGNMPHNWTSAEMINLIRDIFITETDEGLIFGRGIPDSWFVNDACFGVRDMPTNYGVVSYTVTIDSQGKAKVDYSGPMNYIWDYEIKEKFK